MRGVGAAREVAVERSDAGAARVSGSPTERLHGQLAGLGFEGSAVQTTDCFRQRGDALGGLLGFGCFEPPFLNAQVLPSALRARHNLPLQRIASGDR
jgi:hypothetical protein